MKTMTLYRPSAFQGFLERRSSGLSDFDRLFDTLLGDSPMAPQRVFNQLPAVDVRETEKAYLLDMDLPGHSEKDIEIHVDGLNLSIASKKEEVKEEKKEPAAGDTWLLKERRASSFGRTFRLPENANPEEVSAEFKDGILSVVINKRPEAQKRTIPISSK